MNKSGNNKSLVFQPTAPMDGIERIRPTHEFSSLLASLANRVSLLEKMLEQQSRNTLVNMTENRENNATVATFGTPTLVVRMSDSNGSIGIIDGRVSLPSDLDMAGDFRAANGIFVGDVGANNISLLGDIATTNALVTNELVVNNQITTPIMHTTASIINDGTTTTPIVLSERIDAAIISAGVLEAPVLTSPEDISILPASDHTVNVPNIRYHVVVNNFATVDPSMVKFSKVFVVNKNILLQGDATCDGMEIILYNQGVATIIIRDTTCVIKYLQSKCAVKMVYIFVVNRWVKI